MNYVTEYDIGVNKPDVPKKVHDNWQNILDSLATIADVPSALIMHVLPDKIEVASTSRTRPQDNPYEVNASEHLGCGLYCETVMKEKAELHVKNSLRDDAWKDNPDVAIDMISYYGQPVLWSDKTVYGTMCILDKKDLELSDSVKKLMMVFRKAVENELEIIEKHHLQKELLQEEIDHREQAEKDLIKAKEKLDKSLDIIDKHIIYSKTDNKGIILESSSAFEELSGYSKDELIGKSHNIVKHPANSKDFFKEIWKTIKSGKSWQGTIKNRRKDGSSYYVMSTIDPQIDDKGNITGYISLRQDITQQKEQETQLLKQSRLAQMGEMISMIAHQWRQPLAAISSTSIDMKMQSEFEHFDLEKKEEAQKYEAYINNGLKEIDGLVQNLTTTIDDFRNFYKPNKELVTLKLEDVVAKALKIIKLSLINENIEIIEEYNYKEEIELYDNEMMQVVLNILKNAQDNFIEKQIKDPYIKITTQNSTISISDNGGGISEDIIEKIFDPYFSTKNEKNGTGLGLYMSKMIVEEHHNAKLKVKNTDDGVCFIIELGIISEEQKL